MGYPFAISTVGGIEYVETTKVILTGGAADVGFFLVFVVTGEGVAGSR